MKKKHPATVAAPSPIDRPLRPAAHVSWLPTAAAMRVSLASLSLVGGVACAHQEANEIQPEPANAKTTKAKGTSGTTPTASVTATATTPIAPTAAPIPPPGEPPAVRPTPVPSSSVGITPKPTAKPTTSPAAPAPTFIPPKDRGPQVKGTEMSVDP